jgi:hypothetical protein
MRRRCSFIHRLLQGMLEWERGIEYSNQIAHGRMTCRRSRFPVGVMKREQPQMILTFTDLRVLKLGIGQPLPALNMVFGAESTRGTTAAREIEFKDDAVTR